MIDAELFREEGILTVFPTGALAERDFTALAGLVDPFIEAHGRLDGLMPAPFSFSSQAPSNLKISYRT